MLAAHKRPLHTIIPAMMTKGDIRIAFGIMGGARDAQGFAKVTTTGDTGLMWDAAATIRYTF